MVNPKLGSVEPLTAPENGDWNHRSELSLSDKQRSISQVVEETHFGEEVRMEDRSDETHRQRESEKQDKPTELSEEEEKEAKAKKYENRYGHYW